jgi:hypothetical protein
MVSMKEWKRIQLTGLFLSKESHRFALLIGEVAVGDQENLKALEENGKNKQSGAQHAQGDDGKNQVQSATQPASGNDSEKPVQDQIRARMDALAVKIQTQIPKIENIKSAETLLDVQALCQRIEEQKNIRLVEMAETAVEVIICPDRDNEIEKKALDKIYNALAYAEGPTATITRTRYYSVIKGMLVSLFWFICFFSAISLLKEGTNSNISPMYAELLKMGIWGSIGSIASVLIRIDQIYQSTSDRSKLFITGLFRPLIGFMLAPVTFAAVKSGWIPLSAPTTDYGAMYWYIVLAFVTGFSERIGVMDALENKLNGAQKPQGK